jgi:hypothetical protein
MAKIPDKDTYVEFWRPRIGVRSARCMWWSKMVIAVAPIVVSVAFIIVFVSVKLNFRFALALAWILGTTTILFVLTAGASILMSYRSAGKLLGMKVNAKSFPPVDDSSYRRWCHEHGLAPFQASKTQDRS